jgi:hypothetical protein
MSAARAYSHSGILSDPATLCKYKATPASYESRNFIITIECARTDWMSLAYALARGHFSFASPAIWQNRAGRALTPSGSLRTKKKKKRKRKNK